MVEFLVSVHILECFEVSPRDIKIDYPVICLLTRLQSIELERVDDAFIFWSCNFIEKLCFFLGVNPIIVNILYTAALGIFEEDRRRSIFKYTPHEVDLVALPVSRFLTVKVYTFVERLVLHPDTVQSFFTIRLPEARLDVHAFTLDELNFWVYFEDLLFSHDLFFLLNYRWGKRFQRLTSCLTISCLGGTDPNLVDSGGKQIVAVLRQPIMAIYFHTP